VKSRVTLTIILLVSIAISYYFLTKNKDHSTKPHITNTLKSLTKPATNKNNDDETKPPQIITLAIGGDVMLDRYIRQKAQENSYEFIVEKIKPYFADADFALVDLEGPVTTNKSISIYSRIGSRENYVFTFAPESLRALESMGIDLVSIGNNHILNQGHNGLISTKKYLNDITIPFIGDPDETDKTYIKDIKGVKFAFINYNDFDGNHESKNNIIEKIKDISKSSDYIVVYTHWGVEYVATAGENYQNLAHQFVDAGADLVAGAHPHVIQQNETYKNKPIFYSLGNLVMDQYFEEDVMEGLILIAKVNSVTLETETSLINTRLDLSGQTQVIN
jgi:poly-gamma-glutamate synthesis protein (capsule biosynthesis protein)